MAKLFDPSRQKYLWLTCVAVLLVTLVIAIRTPWGLISLDSKELLSIVIPVAGTLVALALPAIQLAQSVMDNWLSSAGELIKSLGGSDSVITYLENLAKARGGALQTMLGAMFLSIASLVTGLLADISQGINIVPAYLSLKDLLSALSLSTLLAAIGWLIPPIMASFDFSKVDDIMRLLKTKPAAAPTAPAPAPPIPAPPPAAPATAPAP